MGDFIGGDQINQGDGGIGKIVIQSRERGRSSGPKRPSTVLMLLSNPIDTAWLRLDEEHRAVDREITGARFRDQLDLRVGTAPRYHDLHDLLLRHRPAIVHYAGHSDAGGIALVDDHSRPAAVPPRQLEQLFRIVSGYVRCVVLNACLTESQASAIAAHIPCVVGMSRAVRDEVAIAFAAGFYRAVADGESLATSFEFGRNRIGPDARDPVLKAAPGAAENLFITSGDR
jgi:hypothetical protein